MYASNLFTFVIIETEMRYFRKQGGSITSTKAGRKKKKKNKICAASWGMFTSSQVCKSLGKMRQKKENLRLMSNTLV